MVDGSPVADYTSPRRPDASMSLLTDLASNSLEEEYAQVARRRAQAPHEPRRRSYAGLVTATVVFGLLIAVAAVQTDRSRPAAAEERAQLIERIRANGDAIDEQRAQTRELSAEVAGLQADATATADRVQALERQARRLGMSAGSYAVTGPGLQVTVDDADPAAGEEGQVLDTDLQSLVNGLWVAGAEAVSINDQRITSRSWIRGAAQAITVNGRSLRRPYVVRAIGNPDTIEARFFETEAGQAWLDWQRNFGVRFETVTQETLTVPGRPVGDLRYAEASREVPQ
jgi:uncharacterized protein YlxW (UPF0749 family)